MSIHKTKGIVVSSIKYGETSIITHIYTELFGMQHYLVKGVRKQSRKKVADVHYFQPGALLDLEVYHNTLKELQYIKEYEWHFVYQNTYTEVARHMIATYCAELTDNLVREPEADPVFFDELQCIFLLLDRSPNTEIANIPVYLTLKILGKIGFSLSGRYDTDNFDILDLVKGCFTSKIPLHNYYVKGTHAKYINDILHHDNWSRISFKGTDRTIVLQALQDYLKIHIENFKTVKSLKVLETIFC